MITTKRLLLDLIGLFERSAVLHAVREGLPLPGVPGSEVIAMANIGDQERAAWLNRVGDVAAISVASDDGPVIVEINDDDDHGAYYRCPFTFKKRLLTDDQAGLFSVDAAKFLDCLAELLSIPQALRTGIAKPAIDEKLWRLGNARIGSVRTDIWVVRGLHESYEEIFQHLSGSNQPDQGVILTTSGSLANRVERPRRYCFIPLAEVICEVSGKTAIDSQMILRFMSSPTGAEVKPSLPVEYDEFNGILKINGKEPWTIDGQMQRGVIHHLYDAYCKGQVAVQARKILKAVGCGGEQHGKSRKMQDIFSGNPNWKQYIHTVERGMYAFKLN